MFQISRKAIRQCSSALAAVLLLSGTTMAAERTFTFQIPRENAAQALNDFAKQAGVRILFPYDLAATHMAPAISGKYTRDECLAFLLKDTGLEVAEKTDTAITLRAVRTVAPVSGNSAETPTEVIVTGTHIRGGNPTSPVHTLTQKDIERSGYSQIGDLMRSLPENFAGGQNPGVFQANATNLANSNATNASTMNLRGLGSDATLVLVNGHRLSADFSFQGADISGIPLAAIQRIEVVPDGASALYGSDAVAGVANFILRRNFDGGEISARAGDTAEGGGTEATYSALLGKSSGSWYALGNIELSRQDGIRAADRQFTASATPITTLIPSQNRRSTFFSTGVDLSDTMKVSFDALLSERSTLSMSQVAADYDAYEYPGYVSSHNLAATFESALAGDWRLRATLVRAASRDKLGTKTVGFDDMSYGRYFNETTYGEVTADGTLLTLPTGPLKTAVGGGYRQEGFRNGLSGNPSFLSVSRNVQYVYAEALAPLVAPSSTRPGLKELELNLSVRSERYSDFGSSTNPKIGLRYMPVEGLTLRASWGKSFKAPSFTQMYQSQYLYLWRASSVGSTANGNVMMTYGGNPDLKPERSTSWSLGAEYTPANLKSLTLAANYFNVDYTDRVVQPVPQYWLGLANPIYAPFVEAAPSSTRQVDLIASARSFFNFSGSAYDPANVIAVLNDTYQNAATQSARGMDLSYHQTFHITGATVNAFGNATWLTLNQQTIVTAPDARLSGAIFNAPKFKARGGVNWQRAGLSVNAIVNFIDEEKDTAILPVKDVASWTTVDGNIAYAFADTYGYAKGVRLTLAASNLFDRQPPYTISPTTYGGIHFDSTNASIVGRFVSLTLSKSW